MPRPKTTIHNFFEDDEKRDDTVICRQDDCGKQLRRHAGNLKRHLELMHPSAHAAFLLEEGTANNNDEEQHMKQPKKICTPPVRTTRSLNAPPSKPNSNLIEKAAELWIIKLQNMEPTQALIAEKLINDIISNGQLGNLNKNSNVHIGLKLSDPLSSAHYQNGACSDEMREEYIEINQKQSFN